MQPLPETTRLRSHACASTSYKSIELMYTWSLCVHRDLWRFGAADFESVDHVENTINRSVDAIVSPPRCFVVWVVARLWGWSSDGGVVVGLPLSSSLNSHSVSPSLLLWFLNLSFLGFDILLLLLGVHVFGLYA